MKILVIDNNIDKDCWGSKDIVSHLIQLSDCSIETRRAPEEDLPLNINFYDKIIISGSKTSCLDDALWIKKLDELIKNTLNLNKPLLGICFGHQSLCRVLGGKSILSKSKTPEFGWTKIKIKKKNTLLNGLSDSFYSYSSHYEETTEPPKQMAVIASSERCAIQGLWLTDKPIFGIQFHPEKNEIDGNRSLLNKLKSVPKDSILGHGNSKQLYSEKVGEIIFNNFLKI